MHGSWMHLGGNMPYLWNFGNNVELRFGLLKFIIFGESGGVAYGAHIGGFIVGLIMGFIARTLMKVETPSVLQRQYSRDASAKRYW